MNIVQVPIADLKFADYNPRKITEKQINDLKASIEKFGMVEPVVVNNYPERLNTIIGGHQRVRVCEMLGMKEVPVIYVTLDFARERELNIRLNQNGGDFDMDMLANQFEEWELMAWGFSDYALHGSPDEPDEEDPSPPPLAPTSGGETCPECGQAINGSKQ